MGLEKITPAVLGGKPNPGRKALIVEYEANKRKMEKLLAETHDLEKKLGIEDKNRGKFNQAT